MGFSKQPKFTKSVTPLSSNLTNNIMFLNSREDDVQQSKLAYDKTVL